MSFVENFGLSNLKGWEHRAVNVEQRSENPELRDFDAVVKTVALDAGTLELCAATPSEHRKKVVLDLAGADIQRFSSPGWKDAVRVFIPSGGWITLRKWN